MNNKVAIVFGLANQRSLAWYSTLALLNHADFTHVVCVYQNDRYKEAVERIVAVQNAHMKEVSSQSNSIVNFQHCSKRISTLQCDVSYENEVQYLFTDRLPSLLEMDMNSRGNSHQHEMKLDALVHSVAFAPSDAMKGHDSLPLLHTSQDAFVTSHIVSAFSLLTVSKHALDLLSSSIERNESTSIQSKRSPSITALTYIGSSRAVRNYNIMGPAKASLESIIRGLALELGPEPYSIRVNGVSSGPVNTLAARGIKGFVDMKQEASKRSCLNRNVTADEVANVVAFLADGERSSGITGQIVFCDSGLSSVAI